MRVYNLYINKITYYDGQNRAKDIQRDRETFRKHIHMMINSIYEAKILNKNYC